MNHVFDIYFDTIFLMSVQSIAICFEREIQKIEINEININFEMYSLETFSILRTKCQQIDISGANLCLYLTKRLKIMNGTSF